MTLSEVVKVVKVKDIKTQLKDGKGKLGLTLECYGDNRSLLEINIPDIDLNIPELEITHDDYKWHNIRIPYKTEGYIGFKINEGKNGDLFTYKTIERTVTKEELEKELGYKLNIK